MDHLVCPPTLRPKVKENRTHIKCTPQKSLIVTHAFRPSTMPKKTDQQGKIMQPLNDLQIAYILSDRHLLRHRSAFADAAFPCRGRADSCLAFKDFPKL